MKYTIIQIGANRGDDDLTRIINSIGPSNVDLLLLIEPMVLHHESLTSCYRSVTNKLILSAAVLPSVPPDGTQTTLWYHIADGPAFEVTGLSKEHIKKHSALNPAFLDDSGYKSITSPSITVNHLVKMLGIKHVDLLFIDAEGLDAEIVLSLDFEICRYENVVYEHLHIPSDEIRQSVDNYLTHRGMALERGVLSHQMMTHAYLPMKPDLARLLSA